MPRAQAFALAQEKGLDIIEIAPLAKPPVARIIDYDKFRYRQEKEDKKQRRLQKQNELKQVRITARAAANDLQVRVKAVEKFLNEGHKVEIDLALRGREKNNKEWALQKMRDFLSMITVPYITTMAPRPGGRGFVAQITKK
jgi:translation initiation factor IF-3